MITQQPKLKWFYNWILCSLQEQKWFASVKRTVCGGCNCHNLAFAMIFQPS